MVYRDPPKFPRVLIETPVPEANGGGLLRVVEKQRNEFSIEFRREAVDSFGQKTIYWQPSSAHSMIFDDLAYKAVLKKLSELLG